MIVVTAIKQDRRRNRGWRFFIRDTHQETVFAFWSEDEAIAARELAIQVIEAVGLRYEAEAPVQVWSA